MANLQETLSALVDGECTAVELDAVLDACAMQPELMQRYSRHRVVSEVQGGRQVYRHTDTLCVAVMRGIAAPAPAAAVNLPAAARARRAPTFARAREPRQDSGQSFRRRRWQAAGGLALAASLGAVVAVGAYRFLAFPGAPANGGMTVAMAPANQAPPSRLASVSLRADTQAVGNPGAKVREVQWSQLDPRTAQRLDDYIMEHAGYGGGQVMGGPLSYARISAHDNTQAVSYSPMGGAH